MSIELAPLPTGSPAVVQIPEKKLSYWNNGLYEVEEPINSDGSFRGYICRSSTPQGRPGTLYNININLKYDANKSLDDPNRKSNNGIPH